MSEQTAETDAIPFDPNECGNCDRCGHCDPPEDDHEWCRRCGGPNVIWSCQSPLWNYVMRGNDINGEPRFSDLVCMPCFVLCAAETGLPECGWRLTLVPEPDGLIYETPSGRTWNERLFLWVDPIGDRMTTHRYSEADQRADTAFLVGARFGREQERARLSAVEALADEWEAMGVTNVYESAAELAQILRSALDPA